VYYLGGYGCTKAQVDEVNLVGSRQRIDRVRDVRVACTGLGRRENPGCEKLTSRRDPGVRAKVRRSCPDGPGHMGAMGVNIRGLICSQYVAVDKGSNRNRVSQIGLRTQSRVCDTHTNSVPVGHIDTIQSERLMPPAERSIERKRRTLDHLLKASASDNH
jgi:hypothetical protein